MATAPFALQTALMLAYDAAMRIGTLTRLTPADCDFDRSTIGNRTKSGQRQAIPMTPRVRDRLTMLAASLPPTVPFVSAHRARHKPYSRDAMQVQLNRHKKHIGVTTPWTFHDLRRTAARALYAHTGDIRQVQRLLSHQQLRTTCWYLGNHQTNLTGDQIAAALNGATSHEPR